MIPELLSLTNFLSYREATLDFRGLHTACVCGANGAGKSSLLEAITWVLWGQSRVEVEDDVIHVGEQEAKVEFRFQDRQQTYRAIRARQRGQSSTLEFQIATQTGFRSLTEKGVRATQQIILNHIRLDYETFVNSAYLRQGQADAFMLKRPSDRKQILADLLKLDRYDELADQSRDRARQYKGQAAQLEQHVQGLETQLEQRGAIAAEQIAVETLRGQLQEEQQADETELRRLRAGQQQRHNWEQQVQFLRQQQATLTQDCDRIQQELLRSQQRQQDLATKLAQESDIETGYAQFQALQGDEETQSAKFQEHQTAQTQRQKVQQEQMQHISQLKSNLQQEQARFNDLEQQAVEIQQILRKIPDVEVALAQLREARSRLNDLDRLQTQASPLMQRRQHLQSDLDRQRARLSARLEELQSAAQHLQAQQDRQPLLQQTMIEVEDRIEQLEKRRIYQQRVREKGLERRSFLDRLQERQRDYEAQLGELEQNREKIGQPDALCPLCQRPLDEHHWQLVQEQQQLQQQEIQDQLWVVREQLAVSEKEIQVLRQEYRDVDQELATYGAVLERRGQLQEQLQGVLATQEHLEQIGAEIGRLEAVLQSGEYAAEGFAELQLIEDKLQDLDYDDKTHALARGEADRWRWAEIKQAEIQHAQRKQKQLAERQPEIQAHIADLQTQLDTVDRLPLQQEIDRLDRRIAEIGYSIEHHNQLRVELRQAQVWQLRYQELVQARQDYPVLEQRQLELTQTLESRSQALEASNRELETLISQLEQTPDCTEPIQQLEHQQQHRRQQLDECLAQLGRLQQQQQHLDSLQEQLTTQQEQFQTVCRQHRVYQELAQAFGKKGIQALMIENILPQLEASTNQILARLSDNQLHVQFITQRLGRSSRSSSKKNQKIIETLDILIADARGTRPYETYSGGEAFRVNFAIRLALAHLLAQRSGTALQMLIVDEGFGTQDGEGCDRLIAAINAIAPDFACILTVTHMPHFKEAFQARIEISKTQDGSQLKLLF